MEKLLVSGISQNPFSDKSPKNIYYSKDFCTKVLKFIGAKICNTSKLMLGDLSRHIRSCTCSQKSLYVKYSERCKKLAKTPFQTYLQNNRTQGSIEQHFGYLKCNYLGKKGLSKLDEFIYGIIIHPFF